MNRRHKHGFILGSAASGLFFLLAGCTTGKWETSFDPQRAAYVADNILQRLGDAATAYSRAGYYNQQDWNDWEQFRTYQTVRQIQNQQMLDRFDP